METIGFLGEKQKKPNNCGVWLLSIYYLQLNENVVMLSPCCCIVFAELSTGQI